MADSREEKDLGASCGSDSPSGVAPSAPLIEEELGVVTVPLNPAFKANLEFLTKKFGWGDQECIRRCVSAAAGQAGMDDRPTR